MNMEFAFLLAGVLLILAGCFCLIRTYHLLKIIIGMELSMKAVTLLFVIAGRINGNMELSQAFIITIIVIEVVITLVASGVALDLYKKYGNLDVRNLRNLRG
ncbi:MAG: NADH-quinone oxidoreductase subunit K [Clostridia bacterium]|nr:NADH-quinone oxidoreductase subunit K [Clostridia bacterium]